MAERTERAPTLASDLARDPLGDLLPLPDPELNPDELDEHERLPLDLRPDAELPLEEVPDCDLLWRGGSGTFALGGRVYSAGGEQAGRPCDGIVSDAVEVEAAGITLALLTGRPRELQMMASFKASLALWLPSKDRA